MAGKIEYFVCHFYFYELTEKLHKHIIANKVKQFQVCNSRGRLPRFARNDILGIFSAFSAISFIAACWIVRVL